MKCKGCGKEMTKEEQLYGAYCVHCWTNPVHCERCGRMLTQKEKSYANGKARFCVTCWNEILEENNNN